MKICADCGLEKPESEFNPVRSRHTGERYYRKMCKLCYNKKQSAYKKERLANMDPLKRQRMNLRKCAQVIGLDPDLVESHFNSHSGHCDICGERETMKSGRLYIDHCHKTGKFRGLLCSKCNSGLGYFRDNQALMHSAIAYLNSQ